MENLFDLNQSEKMFEDSDEKSLAFAIANGEVFTHYSIEGVSDNEAKLAEVFTPLAFLPEERLAEIRRAKPYIIYEYVKRRKGETPDGYPVFESMKYLPYKVGKKVMELAVTFSQNLQKLQ